jgi:hypothetical protein
MSGVKVAWMRSEEWRSWRQAEEMMFVGEK